MRRGVDLLDVECDVELVADVPLSVSSRLAEEGGFGAADGSVLADIAARSATTSGELSVGAVSAAVMVVVSCSIRNGVSVVAREAAKLFAIDASTGGAAADC